MYNPGLSEAARKRNFIVPVISRDAIRVRTFGTWPTYQRGSSAT
jgi:hypothetical protein